MSAIKLRIDTLADIPNAISRMQVAGAGHRVPVLQALYAGRIATWEAQRTGCTGQCKHFLAMVRMPALVIVGDDDEAAATGPKGWEVAERLLKWSSRVMLHATGGLAWHYEAAVVAAEKHRRLVLVECGTTTLPDWQEAVLRWAPQATVLIIKPTGEGAHPMPPSAGETN